MQSPLRIAFVTTGLALVLSMANGCGGGCVLGIIGCPQLEVQPQQLSFAMTSQSLPSDKTISIRNDGQGTLKWKASANQPWLSISPTSGQVTSGNAMTIDVKIDLGQSNLSNGSYTGQITVNSPNTATSSSSVTLNAQLSVSGKPAGTPILAVSTSKLNFATTPGSQPSPQTVSISNNGGGRLRWQITSNAGWITAKPKSGRGPAQVNVSVSPLGLKASTTHETTLTVKASNAPNSPQTISVKLRMEASVLKLDKTQLSFVAQEKADPGKRDLKISNSGSGTLNWTIRSPPWINVTPTQGSGDKTATVSIDAKRASSQLGVGKHTGTIQVRASGAKQSPQDVTVTYRILVAKLYWISDTPIRLMSADLHPPRQSSKIYEPALPQKTNAWGLALHNGYLYWVEAANLQQQKWKIRRVKLDDQGAQGAAPETVVTEAAKQTSVFQQGWPSALAFHGNRLFWIHRSQLDFSCRVNLSPVGSSTSGGLYRADLGRSIPLGKSDLTKLKSGSCLEGIATYAPSSSNQPPKLIWSDFGGALHQARLDGSNARELATPSDPAIVLHMVENCFLASCSPQLYWASPQGLHQAKPDGSQQKALITGLPEPVPFTVDNVGNRLYWVDGGSIHRAASDGTNTAQLSLGSTSVTDVTVLAGKRVACPIGDPLLCGGWQPPILPPPPPLPPIP